MSEDKEKIVNDDEYEKICYMCRRPESKAGKMVTMPGNKNIVRTACRELLIH
jgi:ATP-dependent Clp protease ATP-binding subunit ClpX